jgi:hypothetical protein
MFGGSISLDCFGGFLDQIITGKKGTVVWPSVAMSDCFGRFVAMFFGGLLNQITNYDRKKGTVIWLTYTICNTRNILFLLCLYLKQGK